MSKHVVKTIRVIELPLTEDQITKIAAAIQPQTDFEQQHSYSVSARAQILRVMVAAAEAASTPWQIEEKEEEHD